MNFFKSYSLLLLILLGCSKQDNNVQTDNKSLKLLNVLIDEQELSSSSNGIELNPSFTLEFDGDVSVESYNAIELLDAENKSVSLSVSNSDNRNVVIASTNTSLKPLAKYRLIVRKSLKTNDNQVLDKEYSYVFSTAIDNSDKFERVTLEELLTKIQEHTFGYFWDFAHPISGMIRERSTSDETVTTGGTGFGVMAIIVGIERDFISRQEGLERVKTIVNFLENAEKYHGAFSHWYNGSTGITQPFSATDDGADLVETSLLFQGLITAREYFDDPSLSSAITALFDDVEWSFFTKDDVGLYWHWSKNHGWDINLLIRGWNEALLAYVLAAGSKDHGIALRDYEIGWANSGQIVNNNTYFGINLPLGTDRGGPLFLSQYSFLGLNPHGLSDKYANYADQVKNHTLINRAYCIENPNNFYGYGSNSWGLTASDDIDGYMAHSPTNDNGVISPTAAIGSIAFTPEESIQAIEYFYYKLGDKLWGEYGFKDAFSLSEPWFADTYLAIDQGPIIISIENYRSGVLWENFMKAPEVKNGLIKLNFSSPHISK